MGGRLQPVHVGRRDRVPSPARRGAEPNADQRGTVVLRAARNAQNRRRHVRRGRLLSGGETPPGAVPRVCRGDSGRADPKQAGHARPVGAPDAVGAAAPTRAIQLGGGSTLARRIAAAAVAAATAAVAHHATPATAHGRRRRVRAVHRLPGRRHRRGRRGQRAADLRGRL